MSLIIAIGLSAAGSLFNLDLGNIESDYYPEKQIVVETNFSVYSDYVYNLEGQLVMSEPNGLHEDRFYVQINTIFKIPIVISGNAKTSADAEIGYLARILAAESLVYVKQGTAHKISMFTRVCIAESIKNRKNSDFGSYAKYDTYRDVILYTGYATSAKEFNNTKSWLSHPIAKQRFIEEVLPVAIFVFFNDTDFTNNSTGFFTPAKLSKDVYNAFKKHKLVEINGIDPYYEFTFWKV